MNNVYLKGIIKNIEYSHTIDEIVFNKASLIVKRPDGREDILILKFKQFSSNFKDGAEIELTGNIRSYSQQLDGKHKVEIYVFSYFDDISVETDDVCNIANIDGRICRKDTIRTTSNGKHYIHFIMANNIETDSCQKLNSYIPCVAWGKLAKYIDKELSVGDFITTKGKLQSREYKKKQQGGIDIRVAHELLVDSIKETSNDI
jgi:primosomal replication protein N